MDDAESPSEQRAKLAALREAFRAEPDSADLRGDLLFAYLGLPDLHGDPERIEQIVWHVRHRPRSLITRTPAAHISRETSPDAHAMVEGEWSTLYAQHPHDPEIARGYASFVAVDDHARALDILRHVVDADPAQAEVWMDMGRISANLTERLRFLLEARARGASQPNLLAWIARAAVDANDLAIAEEAGRELLASAERARAIHGDRLDWPDRGRTRWVRAREVTSNPNEASALVQAIGAHANQKHWGHTTLGIVALSAGDEASALEHLRASAEVVGEPRLSSYGPSFGLARALCERGHFDEVLAYVTQCESFWRDERTARWKTDLQTRRVPTFTHA